ncbi:hypothetical protein B0H14DRAFT_3461700 [Mycena olivaceomarginata]|nr:hypothetical protein B0H14DRAFT_3461700 [Mycena olivaceomarginata]
MPGTQPSDPHVGSRTAIRDSVLKVTHRGRNGISLPLSSSPPLRLPPRILAQDEMLPLRRSQCILKRTSTTSTTTLRDRGQLRVTLPFLPIDVVPGASPTLPRHPNVAPFRHPDGLTPASPTHIGGTHHRIADSDF